jgi:hypothetical protein
MRRNAIVFGLLALVASCQEKVTGLQPAGGAAASALQEERYLRRLRLDLTGRAATDAELEADRKMLGQTGGTPATRGALADSLMAKSEFAATYVQELENRVFAGETVANRANLLCQIFRNFDVTCQTCPQPVDGNLCHSCECARVKAVAKEQDSLMKAAADLAAGTKTGAIERRFAATDIYRFLAGEPENLAQQIFSHFLGKRPSDDETRNVAALYYGQAQVPTALLFHRVGATYEDLIDIVFSSEVYREAAVASVFVRYLGREPLAAERATFVAGMDDKAPDVRTVIRAVVSSREYFAQ